MLQNHLPSLRADGIIGATEIVYLRRGGERKRTERVEKEEEEEEEGTKVRAEERGSWVRRSTETDGRMDWNATPV